MTLALGMAFPAGAGTPLALAERQVVILEFERTVAGIAVTDPELLALRSEGARVRVTAVRPGRGSLEIAFDDGATVIYEVTVRAARRAAAAVSTEISLQVGEERRLRTPGLARVLLEENGVARVRVEGEELAVLGISPGAASLVLVDRAGARTAWSVRVR
jgi:hypothetical protein